MSHIIKGTVVATLLCSSAFAQHTISGQIVDQNLNPVPFVTIEFNKVNLQSDALGKFTISDISNGSYEVYINEQGFVPFSKKIIVSQSQNLKLTLIHDHSYTLGEVSVIAHKHDFKTTNTQHVDQKYVRDDYGGSLAKSLENMAGVNASGIGSAASKPIVRGLGFNRLLVSENGLKQEGQQWGADHGLEIDALNIEEVEVIKGPATLEYGNEAIAGVIKIKNNQIPFKNSTQTNVGIMYQSVNDNYVTSANHQARGDKYFYKIKGSYSDFADYRTTTDRIKYLDRWMPIYKNRVKNTAGKEFNLQGQVGYIDQKIRSILTLSNYNQKTGFFPGSHGIPSIDRLGHDGDYRNVDFPYQKVNHFKVISENEIKLSTKDQLKFNFGYQRNLRQEKSAFHTHYGNQNAPTIDPDVELEFALTSYDAQAKYEHTHNKNFKTIIGAQTQVQYNNISGYNYLLPAYDRNIYSGFIIEEFQKNKTWKVTAGLRYDYADFKSEGFFDQTLADYLIENNYSAEIANYYANRSENISRSFSNLNGMVGATFQPNDFWDFNLNIGTNFRLPTAIELGSNGIHHGSFRHERGDATLDTEKGYALDFKTTFHRNDWDISVNPYLYYFTNYIFLKPSGQFSILPHGGQIYQYTQSKALLTGFEAEINKRFSKEFEAQMVYEFIYNRQLNDHNNLSYFLPFTPPNSIYTRLNYTVDKSLSFIDNLTFGLNGKYAFQQNNIAQNEDITKDYFLLGASVKANILINNFKATLTVQGSNLLNKNYYNHTSFYRALQLPEQARNIQVMLNIPFGK